MSISFCNFGYFYLTTNNYYSKATKTLYIPKSNIIKSRNDIAPLKWYSKRAKLYSLFNKSDSQWDDLQYASSEDVITMCNLFAKELLRLDIWNRRSSWPVLEDIYNELKFFSINNMTQEAIIDIKETKKRGIDIYEKKYTVNSSPKLFSYKDSKNIISLLGIWHRLHGLGGLFEQYCKEWWLPI